MRFTPAEIELARKAKQLGLNWTPQVGQYVWDEQGLIECSSPFHDQVFFILDLKHFLRRAGTIERLQQDLCWLPAWEQLRGLLRELGATDAEVELRLRECKALESGNERLCLYELLTERLAERSAADDIPEQPTAVVAV